ncbi:DUF2922 domain-containing protein [Neobacillus terrae]|uniref:DUF2922 domain-containing protein n=1 Tax=Neobacillus terrae TaxID=3034837 RepID=UPI001407BF6C|nr:DUF2922 domain-containing protein [Neobacillus terrae]NHM32310.1 DUF2922 domain-containing protein [Neobacillus terrae]
MAKTLELEFVTEGGKPSRIVIDNPKEPVDQAAVKQRMEEVIAAGIFVTTSGVLSSAKGSRLIERNVTDYPLA